MLWNKIELVMNLYAKIIEYIQKRVEMDDTYKKEF
jgi:hypothetical protein